MGALFDLLKEIPLSGVLKEKIAALEAKHASVETELAIKKDDLREAQAENKKLQAEVVKLKDEINRLAQEPDLHETEIKILVRLADPRGANYEESIAADLRLHPTRLDYYLQSLSEKDYIYSVSIMLADEPTEYHLDQKGREFLIKHNLI